MVNRLSNWGKAVRIEMILRGMTYDDIAKELGLARTYLSALVNGKVSSNAAERRINDLFDLPNGDFAIQVKYIPKRR